MQAEMSPSSLTIPVCPIPSAFFAPATLHCTYLFTSFLTANQCPAYLLSLLPNPVGWAVPKKHLSTQETFTE